MWNDFLYSVWFFLPAGIANVMPILVCKLPLIRDWDMPIDCGIAYKGKQVFGANKTWRGLVFGVLAAELVFLLQRKYSMDLGVFSAYLKTVQYQQLSIFLGFLLGFGAIAGDAIESFFKRQNNIKPGHSWFPFDQLDYIIGGCISAALIIILPLQAYVWVFFTWFIMHLIFSYLGFLLHLKAKPI